MTFMNTFANLQAGLANALPTKMARLGVLKAIVVLACGVFLMTGMSMAHARSKEMPVVLLSCPQEPAGLCRAAVQAVAEISQGRFDIRQIERGQETPGRPGDIGMALTIDGQGTGWIAAHVEWQSGPSGSTGRGPSVELSVMDTALTDRMYARFAQNMLRADTALHALLSCRSQCL